MTKANYSCTQQELYTACRLGWASLKQHQTAFSDFKPKYKSPYADDRLTEVEAAAAMPDFQARDSESEGFREELKELARRCCDNWQKLKRYISDAWTANLQKSKLEAAGATYYTNASRFEWEACNGLNSSASNFITANNVQLSASDNMPSTFPTQYDADKTAFQTKHQEFLDSEENARIGTENKTIANNDCYAKLISMFKDGQEIFKNEDALLKQFIFDEVLLLIHGGGKGGLKGTITDAVTNAPLAEVTISVKGSDKAAITGEDGKYELPLSEGDYDITGTKDAYQPKSTTKKVITGTFSTLDFAMVKL